MFDLTSYGEQLDCIKQISMNNQHLNCRPHWEPIIDSILCSIPS